MFHLHATSYMQLAKVVIPFAFISTPVPLFSTASGPFSSIEHSLIQAENFVVKTSKEASKQATNQPTKAIYGLRAQ